MTKGWDLRSEFKRVYFKATAGAPQPTHRSATTYAKSIRTIVVDAPNLTDGAQDFVETWTLPGTSRTPRETASRATCVSTPPLMVGLHHATTTPASPFTIPAYSGGGAVEWTAWHRGELLELTMAGGVEVVLRYCDLTENERERITIKARALSQGGHIVFAAASGNSPETAPGYGMLSFDGLIICKLHLLPGTLDAVTRIHHTGIRLVYITAAPEDLAMYIAHAAIITDYPKAARHGEFVTSSEHDVYAGATRVNARRIIGALPQPLLIARHPLRDLVLMLESYR